MSRSRRTYLYSVALFGLVVSLTGLVFFLWRVVSGRAALLLGAEPPGGVLSTSALPWLLLFLLALATWIFHIVMANQAARPLTMAAAVERVSPERKAYLYMGRLAAVAALVGQLWLLIRAVVASFLDGGVDGLAEQAAWPVALVTGVAASLAYWLYLRHEARRDGDLGQEQGSAARWRRAYTYLAALAGALLAFGGGGELLRVGIRLLLTPLSGDTSWHVPAAGALAALVLGLPLASLAWGVANRAASAHPASEVNALSRVLLRYAGVLAATLVTLVALGYLIEQVILRAISRPEGAAGRPLLGIFDWPWALAYLPVAAATWISFSSGVRVDAAWGGERSRTATIRRVVRYLLAAASLAAFWYGLTQFARLILQVFLGAEASSATAAQWVQSFATSAAFLLVGAPSWWGHWWSQQTRARAAGTQGHHERASVIRRVYLIAAVLAGSVVVVAAAGFGAFMALNWQSAAALGGVRAAVAGATAAALVALFWTLVHGLTLRGDLRWLAAEVPVVASASPAAPHASSVSLPGYSVAPPVPAVLPAPAASEAPDSALPAGSFFAPVAEPPAATGMRQYRREELPAAAIESGLAIETASHPARALAVIDGGDGVVGAALLAALRAAFPGAVLWPMGLNAAAQVAMLEGLGDEPPAIPGDALARAVGILAPSDVMIPGAWDGEVTLDLIEALSVSPARIVLLPPRSERLRWVAAPDWPLEKWVENAVVEAGNILAAGS